MASEKEIQLAKDEMSILLSLRWSESNQRVNWGVSLLTKHGQSVEGHIPALREIAFEKINSILDSSEHAFIPANPFVCAACHRHYERRSVASVDVMADGISVFLPYSKDEAEMAAKVRALFSLTSQIQQPEGAKSISPSATPTHG